MPNVSAIDLDFGDDFNFPFQLLDPYDASPIDLTLFTVEGQIRSENNEGGTLLASFSGEIVDAPNGRARAYILAAASASLTFETAYFHIRVKSGTRKLKVAKGVVTGIRRIIA